jgi:nucleotide-binding universal stress UspA family protein
LTCIIASVPAPPTIAEIGCLERAMYKNLLIATDGSELAGNAVAQGLALAKALGARVTIVTVTEPWATDAPPELMSEPFVLQYESAQAERADKILAAASASAKQVGMTCSTLHVRDSYAAEGILTAARDNSSDLIVMSSHGRRGLAKFILGSQANEVLAKTTFPVLICR